MMETLMFSPAIIDMFHKREPLLVDSAQRLSNVPHGVKRTAPKLSSAGDVMNADVKVKTDQRTVGARVTTSNDTAVRFPLG